MLNKTEILRIFSEYGISVLNLNSVTERELIECAEEVVNLINQKIDELTSEDCEEIQSITNRKGKIVDSIKTRKFLYSNVSFEDSVIKPELNESTKIVAINFESKYLVIRKELDTPDQI